MRTLLYLTLLCGLGVAEAAVVRPVAPERLAERALLVVDADVVEVESGFDPDSGSLATYVTLAPRETWTGPALERLVLREPGGRHGDLVHVVDAVPRYRVGERVVAIVSPARDGALRTAGMFLGKLEVGDDVALRRLDAGGTLAPAAAPAIERFDLEALRGRLVQAAELARRGSGSTPVHTPQWSAYPPEYHRLSWEAGTRGELDEEQRGSMTLDRRRGETHAADFTPLDPVAPARWPQIDGGQSVAFNLQRAGAPLSGSSAVAAIQAAMQAWNEVPESRLVVALGDDDYDWAGAVGSSPARVYSGVNGILFGDPYDDIASPDGCAGVLAIGGYWRSGSSTTQVNGRSFFNALQGYVIFNADFDCFLGNEPNLAEVGAHELGHALGFGHSGEQDALMRSVAYGNGRGAQLGLDDLDAAHCVYPHTLDLTAPDGGESWTADTLQTIAWSSSGEYGPDDGTVDLEASYDGGQNWSPIASGVPNSGGYQWRVADQPTDALRVRLSRPHQGDGVPLDYPASCSTASSADSASILPGGPETGSVPLSGGGLSLTVAPDRSVELNWPGACGSAVAGYAVYSGDLAMLRAGFWSHAPLSCAADGVTPFRPGAESGSRYYLVAPISDAYEGPIGFDSSGGERPSSGAPCRTRESGAPTC